VPMILADDFTGAAALGGSLRALGLTAMVMNEIPHRSVMSEYADGVVVVNTATRDASADKTRIILEDALRDLWDGESGTLIFRVDSTMRGNIATSAQVGREFLKGRFQKEPLVFVSIANPEAGRTVQGGELFVMGERASTTELYRDPTWSVTTSSVGDFLFGTDAHSAHPTSLPWGIIDGKALDAGAEAVYDHILHQVGAGITAFVLDGRQPHDSLVLAHVLRTLESTYSLCVLDSGPLAQSLLSPDDSLSGDLAIAWKPTAQTILVVAGTSTTKTQTQLDWLHTSLRGRLLPLLDGLRRPAPNVTTIETLKTSLRSQGETHVVALHSRHVLDGSDWVPGDFADAIGGALSEVAAACLEAPPAGLVLVGGETSLHFLREVHAVGLRPGGILEPLMPFGTIAGGPLDGMPVVTKGGLVGDEVSLNRAVRYLQGAITPDGSSDDLEIATQKEST